MTKNRTLVNEITRSDKPAAAVVPADGRASIVLVRALRVRNQMGHLAEVGLLEVDAFVRLASTVRITYQGVVREIPYANIVEIIPNG